MSKQTIETLCFDTHIFPKKLEHFQTFKNSEGMKCVEVLDALAQHEAFKNMRAAQKTVLNQNAFMHKRIVTLEAENKVQAKKIAKMQK